MKAKNPYWLIGDCLKNTSIIGMVNSSRQDVILNYGTYIARGKTAGQARARFNYNANKRRKA